MFSTLFGLISFVALIYLIVEFILFLKNRNDVKKKYKYKKHLLIGIIVFAVTIVVGSIISPNDSDNNKNKSEKTEKKADDSKSKEKSDKQKQADAKKKQDEQKKQQAKKDKEAQDKKEAKLVADTKKKNMAKNYEEYKQALSSVPEQTNGVISSAYIDPESHQTDVVLSADAIQTNDAQMREVAHSAWNAIHKICDAYRVSDNDDSDKSIAASININTPSGDTIAKSSLFTQSFKYVGMK